MIRKGKIAVGKGKEREERQKEEGGKFLRQGNGSNVRMGGKKELRGEGRERASKGGWERRNNSYSST